MRLYYKNSHACKIASVKLVLHNFSKEAQIIDMKDAGFKTPLADLLTAKQISICAPFKIPGCIYYWLSF